MTTNAIIVMAISVGTIVILFTYCIAKVLFSPAPVDDEN